MARLLGSRFLDTGSMYRAVTWVALDRGVALQDEDALADLAGSLTLRLDSTDRGQRLTADGRDITDRLRDPKVEHGVSLVAKVPEVRHALVSQQRAIASEGPIVMAGRDIGTVVLPDASLKVFLTASIEVRARRRHSELRSQGVCAEHEQVVKELRRRDKIDSGRAYSPLRPAEDSVLIDTDSLGIEELADKIVGLVQRD